MASIIAENQGNVIKLDHNQFVSTNRNAAVELKITLEAFGTDHKNQIVKALEDCRLQTEGDPRKLIKIRSIPTMKKVILTGDRPTGRLHVGHYVGSLSERVKLQNSGNYDEIYIMIADAQASDRQCRASGESTPEHYPGCTGLSGMRH